MIDLVAQENTRIDNLDEQFGISAETLNKLVSVLYRTIKEYDTNDYWDVDEMIKREPNDFLYLLHTFLYDAKYAGLKLE